MSDRLSPPEQDPFSSIDGLIDAVFSDESSYIIDYDAPLREGIVRGGIVAVRAGTTEVARHGWKDASTELHTVLAGLVDEGSGLAVGRYRTTHASSPLSPARGPSYRLGTLLLSPKGDRWNEVTNFPRPPLAAPSSVEDMKEDLQTLLHPEAVNPVSHDSRAHAHFELMLERARSGAGIDFGIPIFNNYVRFFAVARFD